MNLTRLFKKMCRTARRILFPGVDTLVIEGAKDDDTADYGQTITVKDFWYAKRGRASTSESTAGKVYSDVLDFYIADGVGLTEENYQANERLTVAGKRYTVITTTPPLSEPRFYRVRCQPTGETV